VRVRGVLVGRSPRSPHAERRAAGAAEGRLLVDASPELRLQLLREGVKSVSDVWITHPHADHLHGIDDLRAFSGRATVRLWVPEMYRHELRSRFPYIFDPSVALQPGTTKPEFDVRGFREFEAVRVLGADLVPLPLPHGVTTVFGFRAGSLGYLTDAKELVPGTFDALRGIETLVVNALWWGYPHPTHFNVEEAIEAARSIGAKRTYLVHLTHRLRHAELEAKLPAGVSPAYDGLTIDA
jgi:phosphoribosyl 1,2-cyclic phosphate phosphodiesterase